MRKLKITSLILVAVMLASMLPFGMFSASAAVTAPTTVPGGSLDTLWEYTTKDVSKGQIAISVAAAANAVSNNLTYTWRGAAGFLLQIDTTAASKLFLQVPMSYGSFGWKSYMRITMAQYNQGLNKNNVGSLESDAYLFDGTNWTKQTTNNWDDCYVDIPAGFSGYLYVPFDQFYWQGNGNNGNVNGGTTPLKGCTAEEFLTHFDTPSLSQINVWTDTANTMTVNSTKVVYADKDLAPKAGDVAEPYEWTSISDAAEGSTRTEYSAGNSATYDITKGNGKPGTGVFASATNAQFDLSDVKGLSVHVDTTGLQGGKQLQFRPYLQYNGGFSDTPYRDNMIVNTTGDVNGTTTYTPFYQTHYTDESYCQFVTRTPGSVVYLRADGSSEWEVLFNYCTGAGIDSWGGFLLPAGFKGDVYIPMSSYWFCNLNNGGSIIIPFDLSLVKDFRSFGLFNSMSADAAEGETNTVVYSNFSVWRDADYDVVEIGTADELVTFFDNLGDYAGKNVVLTNDIVLNAGWDASTGTAPAIKLANRTAENAYFAGTFDGQGHVISGLYLESDLCALGLFGNVDHLTQATVKNVTILNSMINQTYTGGAAAVHTVGLTAAAGSIFGQVMGDITEVGKWIHDPQHVNQTKATIENVYADVDITSAATGGNGMSGYGGFIGVLQSDAFIYQSTFAGSISAHLRGTAGFVGSIYPVQAQNCDHDFDGATQAFYPNDTNGDGVVNSSDTAVYYKNNDATAAVVGTKNVKSIDANHCDLTIYDSVFSGSVSNDLCGFVGGVIGYNNIHASSVTLGNVIITGSITNTSTAGPYTGFIQGGSWSSSTGNRVDGHGNEYQDYRFFNITAYDVEDDTAVQAFGKNNDALKVWYNDINIDWNADGTYSNAEQKYRNALEDIKKCIYVATIDEIPAIINRRDFGDNTSNMLTLEEDLSFKVMIPVGSVVLAPGVGINDVAKVQVAGVDSGIELTLSDDLTYWVGEATFLPQNIQDGLRIIFTGAKYDAEAAVGTLTIHDKSDQGSWSTANISIEGYLRTLIADENSSAELKALAADTIRYATAAKEFLDRSSINTDNLPEGADTTAPESSGMTWVDDTTFFQSIAFRAEGKLAIQIGVSTTDGEYLAQIDGVDAEVVTTAWDAKTGTEVVLEDAILIYINPTNIESYITVTDPDNTVLEYSPVDYFAWALAEDSGISDKQRAVVAALYAYCQSAVAYVNA